MNIYTYRSVQLEYLLGRLINLGKVWSPSDTERFVCKLKDNQDGTFTVGIARQRGHEAHPVTLAVLTDTSLVGAIMNLYRGERAVLRAMPQEVQDSFKSIVENAAHREVAPR